MLREVGEYKSVCSPRKIDTDELLRSVTQQYQSSHSSQFLSESTSLLHQTCISTSKQSNISSNSTILTSKCPVNTTSHTPSNPSEASQDGNHPTNSKPAPHSPRLVERSLNLPNLPGLLPGLQQRRHGRYPRHHLQTRLHQVSRRRHRLDLSCV